MVTEVHVDTLINGTKGLFLILKDQQVKERQLWIQKMRKSKPLSKTQWSVREAIEEKASDSVTVQKKKQSYWAIRCCCWNKQQIILTIWPSLVQKAANLDR